MDAGDLNPRRVVEIEDDRQGLIQDITSYSRVILSGDSMPQVHHWLENVEAGVGLASTNTTSQTPDPQHPPRSRQLTVDGGSQKPSPEKGALLG